MVEHLLSLDGGVSITTGINSSDLAAVDPYYNSTSYGAIILVAASFCALIISIPGLAWHIKNRNLPASSMIGWIVLLNLMNVFNALIWPNDNIDQWWDGQIYCDIEIKLEIASTMGLVGSLACIMRSLAQALDTNNIRLMPSRGQRIRQLVLNTLLCVAFPILIALLHFVLQPLRYYIFAIAGCKASYSSSWYTILLGYIWPPVLCILNGYYAFLLSIRIYRYRRDFSSILASSSSGMNKSRFIRLSASAMTVFIVVLPVQAYALYVNVENGLSETWSPTTWQTIVYVPTLGVVYPDRWVRLGIALPVFLCFAWGKDANSIYRSWLRLLGFTKLFPVLAQPDLLDTSPSNNKESRTVSSFSKSTTIFSKAKTLFSTKVKHSTTSDSILSSLNSPSKVNHRLDNIDIEKNAAGGAGSITAASFNAITDNSDTPAGETEAQMKSWESSQQAMEAAQQAKEYEATVVGRLA